MINEKEMATDKNPDLFGAVKGFKYGIKDLAFSTQYLTNAQEDLSIALRDYKGDSETLIEQAQHYATQLRNIQTKLLEGKRKKQWPGLKKYIGTKTAQGIGDFLELLGGKEGGEESWKISNYYDPLQGRAVTRRLRNGNLCFAPRNLRKDVSENITLGLMGSCFLSAPALCLYDGIKGGSAPLVITGAITTPALIGFLYGLKRLSDRDKSIINPFSKIADTLEKRAEYVVKGIKEFRG